ncbi:transcriptional adapter 2-alpha [Pycnococcus provasolii]
MPPDAPPPAAAAATAGGAGAGAAAGAGGWSADASGRRGGSRRTGSRGASSNAVTRMLIKAAPRAEAANPTVQLGKRRGAPSACAYCHKDTTGDVRIRCAECVEPFELCVQCFSVGASLNPHKPTHRYRVLDDLSFPIFSDDWGADEETRLLEALSSFGPGNWSEVAEHVGSKTKQQCYAHYVECYVDSVKRRRVEAGDDTDGDADGGDDDDMRPMTIEERKLADERDALAAANDPTSAAAAAAAAAPPPPPPRVAGNQQDITGYHARRSEFDTPHEPEAELPLAELELRADDTPAEKSRKLQMLRIYQKRLAERERRRQFVVARGLLNVRRIQAVERKRSWAENRVASLLRPFLRFVPAAEHDATVDGFVHELRLRARIAKLKEYRRAGLANLSDADAYDSEKRRRREAAAAGLQHAQAQASAAAMAATGNSGGMVASGSRAQLPVDPVPAGNPDPVFVDGLGCYAGSVLGVDPRDVPVTSEELSAISGGLDIRLHPGTAYLTSTERRTLASTHIIPASYLAEKAEYLFKPDRTSDYPSSYRTRNAAATFVRDQL